MKEQNEQKTPKWLRRLEKESWQAELIISGLALYGSLQLPDFIYVLIDFLISYLPVSQYFTGYMITYMLLLGVSILSSFFIIHFVLRAYWVGLIGLNSVYPHGYGESGDFYSPIYVRKFSSLLPSVKETIRKVDEVCSTIFASAFLFLMMYGMFSVLVTAFLILYNVLLNFVSSGILLPFFYAIAALVTGFMIFGIIACMKRFRENEQLQHAYFIGSKYFGYFISPLFFKPINQIMLTFYSNYKKGKSSVLLPIVFFAIAIALSMTHLTQSNLKVLIVKGKEEVSFFQKNRTYSEFYEENLKDKKAITNPIIPAEKIKGDLMKIFIPIFKNEEFIEDAFCEPYKNDDSKSKSLNRRLESDQRILCYRKYHQVFVNDSLYQIEFLKHYHPHKDEFGIISYLSTNQFRNGKNQLRAVKLKTPEGEIYDEVTIPFWFSRN